MRDLPTGTVTFLFTDFEGSTRLLHELGDAYASIEYHLRNVYRKLDVRSRPELSDAMTRLH